MMNEANDLEKPEPAACSGRVDPLVRPQIDTNAIVSVAVSVAISGGYKVTNVATTGTVYLRRDDGNGLRIGDHPRRVKSKALRRKTTTINVSDVHWKTKLMRAIDR